MQDFNEINIDCKEIKACARKSALLAIKAIQKSVIDSGEEAMTMEEICEAIKEINRLERGKK